VSVVRSVVFPTHPHKRIRALKGALYYHLRLRHKRVGARRERELDLSDKNDSSFLHERRENNTQNKQRNINISAKVCPSSSNVSKNDAFCVCAETSGFLLLAVHSVLLFVLFIVYDVALFFGRVCDHNHPDKEDLLDG